MDEAIIKYYRKLLRNGFEYTGSFENPAIFLDSVGENIPICGHIGRDYMHLFINIHEDRIEDVKYLCICDPTANVAVEILCFLIKGKTFKEAGGLTEDAFCAISGSTSEDLRKKARGLIQLLKRGLTRFQKGESP
jgi:NifU-like protein involved in Fe-S cluster formation